MGFQKVEEQVIPKTGTKYGKRAPVASIATDDALYVAWKAIVDGDELLSRLALSKSVDSHNNIVRLALKFATNAYKGGVRIIKSENALVTTLLEEGE